MEELKQWLDERIKHLSKKNIEYRERNQMQLAEYMNAKLKSYVEVLSKIEDIEEKCL